CCRTAPDLPCRLELRALADAAPANAPIIGAARAAGEQRGAALPAKMLKPRPAVVARPGIGLCRLSGHPDLLARADRRHAVGRSGQRLTIRTVTNRNLRSEEHTSELQSPCNLVCRLLLEKKKNIYLNYIIVYLT